MSTMKQFDKKPNQVPPEILKSTNEGHFSLMLETTGIWEPYTYPKQDCLKWHIFSSTTLNVVLMPASTLTYAKVLVVSERTSKKDK